jgi:hypothetical protein
VLLRTTWVKRNVRVRANAKGLRISRVKYRTAIVPKHENGPRITPLLGSFSEACWRQVVFHGCSSPQVQPAHCTTRRNAADNACLLRCPSNTREGRTHLLPCKLNVARAVRAPGCAKPCPFGCDHLSRSNHRMSWDFNYFRPITSATSLTRSRNSSPYPLT